MDIKEKAELYEKALEVARKNYKAAEDLCDGSQIGVECFKNTLTSIFPELRESEDERIREALIYHYQGDGCLCTNEYRIDYKDIRTWLEKQGEANTQYWRGYREGKQNVLDKYAELEKQDNYGTLIEEMKKRKELLSKEKEKATSKNDKLSLGGRISMLEELLAFSDYNNINKIEVKFKVGG